MGVIADAPVIWNILKGIICVYKPAGVNVYDLRKTLIYNISKGLCEMRCRPPIKHVFIEGDPANQLKVYVTPSFADHPLVVGPRYQQKDIRCAWASYLGRNTSGVFVVGLNDGVQTARKIHLSRPTRTYHVKGKLGEATDTYFVNGKVVEKATYCHVKQPIIDRILAAIQAAHQKQMFELCGVDPQSQTAYELAAQGPLRPSESRIPLLYGIKCIHFQPPHFTLEIQCINENEIYLQTLIHDIGLQLHSVATCTSVRCIRYSNFTLELALLRKHWHLQHLVHNLNKCSGLLKQHKYMTKQISVSLINEDVHQRTDVLEAT